jgi:hypothetical protein
MSRATAVLLLSALLLRSAAAFRRPRVVFETYNCLTSPIFNLPVFSFILLFSYYISLRLLSFTIQSYYTHRLIYFILPPKRKILFVFTMRCRNILAILSTAVLGCAAVKDAPVVSGNPQDVEYKATLPKHAFFSDAALAGNVKGYVSAVAAPGGKGVKFTVQFENFPKTGGPFSECFAQFKK